LLETRTFDLDDQRLFARTTGDFNPIHLDRGAARRTLAGAPIVHGLHNLLWLLDSIAKLQPDLKKVATLRVHFGKMLFLGEPARIAILKQDGHQLRAKVSVGDADIMQVILRFGDPLPSPIKERVRAIDSEVLQPLAPVEMALDEMQGRSGRLAFASSPDEIARIFPYAARLIGARRVASLGCTTRLVGMVLPGLHSIFSGLEVGFVDDCQGGEEIQYEVETVEKDLRFVRMAIAGAGMTGHVEAFNRPVPTVQPRMSELAPMLARNEFDGSVALVVGGSRGLGELAAKIVAAGGGKVVLTYATGRSDAEAVAREINGEGGHCEVIAYDVTQSPESQLKALEVAPTHIYFFATPAIFRRRSATYSPVLFEEFNSYYVTGFHRLVDYAARTWNLGRKLGVFYPSSSALDRRPENITEYAMSKAAGEVLCEDLAKYVKNLHISVERLPRLLTDQTASISDVESADPISVMLPIVRKVQDVLA
jgi:MaoC like domain/short chain dehydrogenase